MIQRVSGYERIANDTYITPDWVWKELHDIEPRFKDAPDPFPADADFDAFEKPFPYVFATNPPFSRSDEIVDKAINEECYFALLLPVTWDCAKNRMDMLWSLETKIILTQRIRWTNLKQKKNGPSSNHAWYIFDPCQSIEYTPELIYAYA